MHFPLISLVAVFNGKGKNFENSLKSFLNQTYENKEIIVVNYGKKEFELPSTEQVKMFFIQESTMATALNKGLQEAKGEYILFVEGETEIHESYLENGYKSITRLNFDAVATATMYSDGEIIMPLEGAKWAKNLLFGLNFELSNIFMRKSICSKFVENERLLMAWEFWINTLRGRKLHSNRDYVGTFVQRPLEAFEKEEIEWKKRKLAIMEKYQDEVVGIFQKMKYKNKIRALYKGIEK
jgi:glycosyltransferase involved in cell wall biosynthesis